MTSRQFLGHGFEGLLELLPQLVRIALEAGDAILGVYDTDFDVELKSDASPLTEADRVSNSIITAGLAAMSPEVPVLSEEGSEIIFAERRQWDLYWLVDPLDGTKEFVKRNGEFTVNVALIHDRRPVLGVVHIPVQGVLYAGCSKGSRAEAYKFAHTRKLDCAKPVKEFFAAAQRLTAPDSRSAASVRVAGSRSHRSKKFDEYLAELRKKYREVQIITAGSSLKFCLVAEGRADLYPRFGPTWEWDTAAGHAVASAAGAKVLDHESGQELTYNKPDMRNGWFVCR